MTTNGFTLGHANRLRRATFVPAAADIAARRLHIGVVVAATAASAAAVGVVAPLIF